MKKTLALILCAVLLFTVSACSSGGSQSQSSSSAASQSTGSQSQEASADAVSGSLTMLSWHNEETFKPMLEAYSALYPNVKIDFQNVPSENSQYSQRLTLLANSGELPDVFWIQPPLTLFAENGYLAELDGLDAIKNLPESYRNAYMHNGKTYAYVNNAWIGGLFYNKDLFEKYNIKPFTKWQDFLDACKVFSDNGIKPIAMAGGEVPDLLYWLHLTEVLSTDSAFDLKINTGEKTFKEGYLMPLEKLKSDILDKGFVSKEVVGYSDEQRMDEFATGIAATTISGPWAINTFLEKNPNLNLGMMPFTGTNGQTYTIGAVNVGIAISAKAKNRPAADSFVNLLGTKESASIYQQLTGNFMGIDGIEYEVNPVMENMKAYAENGNFAFPPVDWTYSATLSPMIEKGIQEIVLETKTPEQLINELDEKQKELMADAK